MRKVIALLLIIIGAALLWQIGEKLSSDAISMAIGVFFGILAGISGSVMAMMAGRQTQQQQQPQQPQQIAQQQPPVIVINTAPMPQQIAQQQQRRFEYVGEPEYPTIEVRQ